VNHVARSVAKDVDIAPVAAAAAAASVRSDCPPNDPVARGLVGTWKGLPISGTISNNHIVTLIQRVLDLTPISIVVKGERKGDPIPVVRLGSWRHCHRYSERGGESLQIRVLGGTKDAWVLVVDYQGQINAVR